MFSLYIVDFLVLILFLILFIVILLLINNFFRQKRIIKILTFDFKNLNLLTNFSLNRKISKIFLIGLAFVFLILSIMRPRMGVSNEKIKQKSRDLFIALDISRSMLAADIKHNRLEFAKKKIKDLISI